MDKAEAPISWKVKASSYSNLHVWPLILKGAQLADIPIIVASVDPCLSCTDRVAVTDADAGKTKVFTKEELTRLSYERSRRMRDSPEMSHVSIGDVDLSRRMMQ